MIGGPLSYETWHANMPLCLPSPSIVNKFLADYGPRIIEGQLRTEELVQYLQVRKLPLRVSISEDATRITPKICYDPKTNQLVGFALPLDQNGMPKSYSFKARNVKEIQDHFNNSSNHISSSVYVQMVQPQTAGSKEDAPPFCLSLFLTDNKFTSETIYKRWIDTISKLREQNIIVDNFASDADPKFMKVMKVMSELGYQDSSFLESEWYSCGGYAVCTCTQDPIHVVTKCRNRALKTSRLTQIGTKIISTSHLNYLIDNVSKDKHCLTITDIDPKDKQNFPSAEKMCSTKTIECLLNFVPGSEGTAMFLEAMNNFSSSYLDTTLNYSERVYKIWHALFFFRGWRSWLVNCNKRQQKKKNTKSFSNANYTLKENFISSICYHAIELNAHTLVKQVLSINDDNLCKEGAFDKSKRVEGYAFTPNLQGSQQCEGMFRQVRSFSSTFSTVVNCNMLDIMNRIKKIQLQSDIITCCSEEIKFPRFEKKIGNSNLKRSSRLSKEECIALIEKARKDVSDGLIKLGINQRDLDFHCQVTAVNSLDEENCENDDYTDDEFDPENVNEEETVLENENEVEEGLQEDINLLSGITGELCMKDYSTERVSWDEESPFAVVMDNVGNEKFVRKSSICWFLQKDKYKLSSDRLQRVQEKDVEKLSRKFDGKSCCLARNNFFIFIKRNFTFKGPIASPNETSPLIQCEEIRLGQWCVFVRNKKLWIGLVLSFCYVTGKTFREREYSRLFAMVPPKIQNVNDSQSQYKAISKTNKPVGVLCCWYSYDTKGNLTSADDKLHEFVSIEEYRGTLQKPLYMNSFLQISSSTLEALNQVNREMNGKSTITNRFTAFFIFLYFEESVNDTRLETSSHKEPSEKPLEIITETLTETHINVGDYVICKVETEQKRSMNFVGQVLSVEGLIFL